MTLLTSDILRATSGGTDNPMLREFYYLMSFHPDNRQGTVGSGGGGGGGGGW